MDWQEAVALSKSNRARRRDGERVYIRYGFDGSALCFSGKTKRPATPKEVEGHLDWEPDDPAGTKP